MCAINHLVRDPFPRPTPKCRCTNAPPLLSVGMGTCSISPPLGGGRPTPTAGPPVLSSFFGPMVRAWPPPLLLGCRFGGAMPSRVSPNRGRRHVTSTGAGVFFLFFFFFCHSMPKLRPCPVCFKVQRYQSIFIPAAQGRTARCFCDIGSKRPPPRKKSTLTASLACSQSTMK